MNITEMKITLEEINSRLNDIEEWISKLEDRVVEITETKKKKKSEHSLRDFYGIKCAKFQRREKERPYLEM